MSSVSSNEKDRAKLSTVVITAILTALATSLASEWLPGLGRYFYERMTSQPIVVVEIRRGQQPVGGVRITATDPTQVSGDVLSDAATDDKGIARLKMKQPASLVFLHETFNEPSYERVYEKTHLINIFPAYVPLEVEKDFGQVRIVVSTPVSAPARATVQLPKIQYDQAPLANDRRVAARLEIDWIKGTSRPVLEVETKAGALRLETLL